MFIAIYSSSLYKLHRQAYWYEEGILLCFAFFIFEFIFSLFFSQVNLKVVTLSKVLHHQMITKESAMMMMMMTLRTMSGIGIYNTKQLKTNKHNFWIQILTLSISLSWIKYRGEEKGSSFSTHLSSAPTWRPFTQVIQTRVQFSSRSFSLESFFSCRVNV